VQRIVLCSGKVYYDLIEARKKADDHRVAIIRVEQFYPFPLTGLRAAIGRYPNTRELVWAQEEPQNMGGWTFMESRLENLLPPGNRPRYVGRTASASPATGSYHIHQNEQARLVEEALKLT
jgi:2-oxoglutarate dehydrogenase E1 component